jgi:hypothetical protein
LGKRSGRRYEGHNKFVNFFFPSMKIICAPGLLISNELVDVKLIKKYDTAKTSYRRLMESADVNTVCI